MITEYRYLDVIWVDNLVMNFILLWVTLKLSKSKSVLWKLWLAAAVGALYSVFIFLPDFYFLKRLPLKICLSLIMLLIAFKFENFMEFFKVLGFFYCTTFIFGGAALGMYYFFNDSINIEDGVFYIKNYPVKTLIISCLLVIMLVRTIWSFVKLRLTQNELLYRIGIFFDQDNIILEGLLDTGNVLYDPISHYPVVVVEFDKIKELLPVNIRNIFQKTMENDLDFVTDTIANSPWIGRFRMIPFTALGKPNGMLIGFKPDKVTIFIDEHWEDIDNVIVGIYGNKLCKNGHYGALINPEILQ